jgi:hypothetical protein
MKTFALALIVVAFTLLLMVFTQSHSARAGITSAPQPVPTPWPDLTWIKVGSNKSCGIDGAAEAQSEKAKLNNLKNRFELPSGDFEPITFEGLLALKQGEPNDDETEIVDFPNSTDEDNEKAVSIEGYVDSVSVGGCSSGESCNCKTQIPQYCDTHINVLPDKHTNKNGGRNVYVVEVTRRIRILASKGLLSSNIGNDWSTEPLRQKLERHRVRFSGYLYFDTDHSQEAWVNDPENKIGFKKRNGRFLRDRRGRKVGNNWRQTAWEIHPVMAIRRLD